MNFDAQKYISDGGWDFTAIENTVALGVAADDMHRLRDAYGDDADAAADMLLDYCKAAVRTAMKIDESKLSMRTLDEWLDAAGKVESELTGAQITAINAAVDDWANTDPDGYDEHEAAALDRRVAEILKGKAS